MKLLTIGIPTFNRKDMILSLVGQIRDSGLLMEIDVIVIDDASSDSTSDSLAQEFAESDTVDGAFKVIRHEHNQGMAAGFIRIFEECKTDFLMMCADDDQIYPGGVRDVVCELRKHPADFLYTAWLSSGTEPSICRGESVAGTIPFSELRRKIERVS